MAALVSCRSSSHCLPCLSRATSSTTRRSDRSRAVTRSLSSPVSLDVGRSRIRSLHQGNGLRPAYRLRGRDLDDSVDVAALRFVACQPFNRRDGAICTVRHVVENESSIHTANTGREWPPLHAEPMLDTVTRRYRDHGPKHLRLLLRGQPKKPDLRTRACDHGPPTLAQESLALDSTHTTLGSLHQHPRDQADDQEQQRHASHNDEPPRPCLSSFVHRRRRVIPANRSPHLEQRNRSDFAPLCQRCSRYKRCISELTASIGLPPLLRIPAPTFGL